MSDGPFSSLQQRHYRVILCDPPWRWTARSERGLGRSAQKHYRCMSVDEIKALPVGDLAAKDCGLFLWVTDPFLEHGLAVMRAWGFAYKSVGFCWAKLNRNAPPLGYVDADFFMGTGYGTRANSELCLYGSRGAPKRFKTTAARSVRRLIVAPRGPHSAKPLDAQVRIEKLLPGPYAYLFSRTTRQNWDCWGDEVGKLDEAA